MYLTDSRTASPHGDRGLVSVVLMLVAVEHVGVLQPSLRRGRRGHGGGKKEMPRISRSGSRTSF